MVCLEALDKDTRGSERGKGETSTGKNQIRNFLGGVEVGYLDDLVTDLIVPDQVQRKEAMEQGKSDYTDIQNADSYGRALGQPHLKDL